MTKEITGDLIEMAEAGAFDVIAHGCNCHHTMNSGIAKQIKFKIPEAFAVDLETTYGDINKLGTISYTKVHPFTVVNCYTQYHYGKVSVYADYNAIEKCMQALRDNFGDKRIGIPRIGAGRARGDWNKIKSIIDSVFENSNVDITIVNWNQNDPGFNNVTTKANNKKFHQQNN